MIGRDEVIDVEGTRVLNMSGTIFNHVNARLAASSEFKRTNVQEPGLCAVASSSPDFILCIFDHRSIVPVEILAFVPVPCSQHLAIQAD